MRALDRGFRWLLGQRGVRKLLRDRVALVALAVISVYVGIAALILFFDVITLDETTERVGPRTMPGVWESPSLESRLAFAELYLETVQNALDKRSPEKALAEVRFAELELAALSIDERQALLDEGWDLFDELDELDDLDAAAERDPGVLAKLSRFEETAARLYRRPTGCAALKYRARLLLGTDRQGRSILVRSIYSIKVATQIGVVAALISVLIGTLLGGAAAFFGGWVDHLVVWLYSTFSSIPWIVLLTVLASMFMGSRFDGGLVPVYSAFCLSFWIAPCRVIRGEVLKLKELEFVQAATAIGFGRARILLKHVLPNTAHLMFINFSLLFIGAIKAEVILSFLGLGVKNEPSWGVMINHSREEVINHFFWQIGSATFFMVVLVLAFNVLSDALQDAFDPKHVG